MKETDKCQKAYALIRRKYDGFSYRGMGHSESSKLGVELCKAAGDTGQFLHLPGHLDALLNNMRLPFTVLD